MTITRTRSEEIVDEVTSWPGVSTRRGDRGELSIRLGRRELGHLHGDHALHIGFPRAVWHELHAQGRIGYHPVFPGKPGYAARRLEGAEDVRDAIALLRLNYDRAVARRGTGAPAGLRPSPPETLPFAPSHEARAFVLERERGDLLVYSVTGLAGDAERHYLGHGHEAMFPAARPGPPVFVHEADRESVADSLEVRAAFSRRHTLDDDFEVIPMPGHTPGSTAYLWHGPEERMLFTADSLYLDGDEWVAAVLGSSDREAYVESLALLRELEFDVLVPWVAPRGGRFYARTGPADARRRIEAVIERLRAGGSR